jgi:hypothetical protein
MLRHDRSEPNVVLGPLLSLVSGQSDRCDVMRSGPFKRVCLWLIGHNGHNFGCEGAVRAGVDYGLQIGARTGGQNNDTGSH